MKVEEAIKKRRSIRQYSTKAVKWKDLAKVLDAAIYAPMAGNVFSPRFVIVTDKKKKNKIAEACLEQYHIQNAPYFIIVCSDLEEVRKLYDEHAEIYARQQAGASIQNILLQATELGLATCWIGAFEEGTIKSILNIPKNIQVEAVILFGNSTRKKDAPPKKELNKVVYFEEYFMQDVKGQRVKGHEDIWQVRETSFEK